MGIELVRVKEEEKDILYRLLEYSLYDGSFYIDNNINEQGIFEYEYFDEYFTDESRDKYFIKYDGKLAGFILINDNYKFNEEGYTIAEFLVMPYLRRNHIGKEAATKMFDLYPGDWEVQPMENNKVAYSFWKSVVSSYTNNNYIVKNDGIEDVFIFNNSNKKIRKKS